MSTKKSNPPKNNPRRILAILAVALLASCGPKEKPSDKLIIASVVNPNLSFITAMQHLYPEHYNIRVIRSPMEMAAVMQKGEADAVFHTFIGSTKLYRKGAAKDYAMYRPYIYNAVYLVSRKSINSLSDLKDQKVLVAYKGGSPDLMFNVALKHHGMSTEDLDAHYAKPVPILKLYVAGKADFAVIPEYYVSQLDIQTQGKLHIHSLEKLVLNKKEDAPIKHIPIAAVLIKRDSPKIDLPQLDKHIQQTMAFINNQTQKYSSVIADSYKENYNINVNPKVVYNSVESGRLIYNYSSDKRVITYTLEQILGMSTKDYQGLLH